MTTSPVEVMDKQYSVTIPQIPPGLHNNRHMERQEMTCTLVVYVAALPLVTKVLPHEGEGTPSCLTLPLINFCP